MRKLALLAACACLLPRAIEPPGLEGCCQAGRSGNVFPTVSVSLCTPQKAALAIGLTSTGWLEYYGVDSGWLFVLEPGLSGGSVNLGFRTGMNLFVIPLARLDCVATLLYTWNDPWGDLENDQTYAGIRASTWVPMVNASLGLLRHIGGEDDDHDWLVTAGLGVGI